MVSVLALSIFCEQPWQCHVSSLFVSNHSRRESLGKRLESALSLAEDLQVWFAVPVSFIGCLFLFVFRGVDF